MGERPRNMSGRSIPLPAATNTHDNRVGLACLCSRRNDLHRRTELDLYILYSFPEVGIGCGLDLPFGFSSNSAPFRTRPDIRVNSPDH